MLMTGFWHCWAIASSFLHWVQWHLVFDIGYNSIHAVGVREKTSVKKT